ncbi:MAG: tetratricopeptide repeat protein [Planctomycetes bacterium]|nr:tetratricopeptide repeat protein [Planctomycetota bacterium]
MTDKIKLEPEIKKLFDEALALVRKGECEEAIRLLKQIIHRAPDVPFSYGQLRKIAWDQGKLQEANDYFREVTELLPDSSLASLCVFHTFWNMGEYESALREIVRFQKTGRECEDYTNIVRGLQEQEIIDKDFALLKDPTDYYVE